MSKPPKETLYDLYWNHHLTIKQIGEMYGAKKETARDWFTSYGIERRPVGHNASVPATPIPDKQTLVSLYHDQRLSMLQIGKQLGTSAATVQKWLRSYGIGTRSRGTNGAEYPDKPTKEELEHLYLSERLTQRQIGKRYGVSHKTVGHWVRGYGIPQRAQSRGLDNRGIEPPTSDELYRMVHLEHKSYAEIASIYGVDYTAVPHWLVKHGIEKPRVWDTRTNGRWSQTVTPDTETLTDLYVRQHLSTLQIGHQYDVSPSLVRKWLIQRGIERRPATWNQKRFDCIDGHVVKSTYERRVDNWLSLHRVPHEYEPSLPFGGHYKADFLANGYWIEIWGVNAPDYIKRKKRKVQLYKQHGLSLIQITPSCFAARRKDLWARKLAKCLTAPGDVSPAETPLFPRLAPDGSLPEA